MEEKPGGQKSIWLQRVRHNKWLTLSLFSRSSLWTLFNSNLLSTLILQNAWPDPQLTKSATSGMYWSEKNIMEQNKLMQPTLNDLCWEWVRPKWVVQLNKIHPCQGPTTLSLSYSSQQNLHELLARSQKVWWEFHTHSFLPKPGSLVEVLMSCEMAKGSLLRRKRSQGWWGPWIIQQWITKSWFSGMQE